ncbi:2-keto-4-pentenoate hydratase/2-oxohepta-3-ene-1,7-dioic acid hydratase (catechol pathway) [Andreprevotia lacus DSM 23236]|jgi:2-keto-4-pentenoate hydratase/2-oxohepta-3-ene-1,7-dioic acid hydratase in catechol pathway|uniref:2-keto-4-pentenoate hydratase/2-oxohepta-3-ene-1,7-dioic acid hydratase (Catechol pathway) n=1 Tax=Andreprevotia lacus DSM 23236 TaxID=1121001 RepID=A0A1W1WXY4_9NEIS|nr:fumarylacetoacetate hydrolase family protein [Andreprevotia lacus]SMC16589.1 2-keto-4-pentenoate hydratase/2-oxohepta-3-ene-1,7-dioic acid hydratase (catechol pathway) [Andreprevotia lacus DSM 23236]
MPSIQIASQTLPVANIFCVARNYLAHAAEMGSSIGPEPVVFLKPTGALSYPGQNIVLPAWSSDVHHEAELVVVIGKDGNDIAAADAWDYVAGYALGLDLTARDVQAQAKKSGSPWTLSKGFRGAAVLTDFIAADAISPPGVQFSLTVNGELRQQADMHQMAFDVPTLIAWISSRFGLRRGDLIYTGTPEGVGPIHAGDELRLQLPGLIDQRYTVRAA